MTTITGVTPRRLDVLLGLVDAELRSIKELMQTKPAVDILNSEVGMKMMKDFMEKQDIYDWLHYYRFDKE